jgi:ABC-type transporter Mla MlaB component
MAIELYVTRNGESTCLSLLGEFELEGVEQLEARLERLQEDEARPVLDLSRIVVVDQAFAGRGLMRGG